ncbi:MAG: enolase C-terminal domain-like protein [Myxococcota bacterium]|nr:enolase C-terminal domain-like protein [Myxococcota bacterium]
MRLPLRDTPAPLARLELLHLALPRRYTFRSAIGTRSEKQVLMIRWWMPDGSWGIGEASCRADPRYSGEFIDGAVLMLRDHLGPMLMSSGTIGDLVEACSQIRGWPFATAAVLSAALDALRRGGVHDPIDRWTFPRQMSVPVGASLGLYSSTAETLHAVMRSQEQGVRRVKLKICPSMDPAILPAVRAAFPHLTLTFDANGSFGSAHLSPLADLAALDPLMLEQPFPPGRLDLDRRLKDRAPDLSLCLDESITDLGMLYTARMLGVLDVVNLKPGRVGGPLRCDAALRWCRERGVSAWIGGMFETGVGRHANARAASCLPDAIAHDINPPSTYLLEDIVSEPLRMADDGTIALDDAPVMIRWAVVDRSCVRRLDVLPGGVG